MGCGETFCKIRKTGNPTEHKEISSFTCWWFGKCSMAFRSKWVTSARSRTGMPAAKSCLVRLKTHALAANCTGKFRGWFLIPITTSWNARVLPTLVSYMIAHASQEQSTVVWGHKMTHSTQFLPPFCWSEKSIWCDFISQEEHFLLLSDSKLTTSTSPSPSALVEAASQRRYCMECKRFLGRSKVCSTHWDKNQQILLEMNEVRQSFCSVMVTMQWLVVWRLAISDHILSC